MRKFEDMGLLEMAKTLGQMGDKMKAETDANCNQLMLNALKVLVAASHVKNGEGHQCFYCQRPDYLDCHPDCPAEVGRHAIAKASEGV
jgi:hypothetical protein